MTKELLINNAHFLRTPQSTPINPFIIVTGLVKIDYMHKDVTHHPCMSKGEGHDRRLPTCMYLISENNAGVRVEDSIGLHSMQYETLTKGIHID